MGIRSQRKLTPSDTKSLVEAICEAAEDDRKDVGSRAADRAKSNVQSKYDQLERQKDAAIKALETERWESIDRMTQPSATRTIR